MTALAAILLLFLLLSLIDIGLMRVKQRKQKKKLDLACDVLATHGVNVCRYDVLRGVRAPKVLRKMLNEVERQGFVAIREQGTILGSFSQINTKSEEATEVVSSEASKHQKCHINRGFRVYDGGRNEC